MNAFVVQKSSFHLLKPRNPGVHEIPPRKKMMRFPIGHISFKRLQMLVSPIAFNVET
jgi:hypothetical protein